MKDFFSQYTTIGGFDRAVLQTVFDAERETPELLNSVASNVPQIHEVMASLRASLPVLPHSGVGLLGSGEFCRLPNHYRSVSFMVPSQGEAGPPTGAIVFKGTEPLIADFPAYLDWMLDTPFRESVLPMGLHFPLDLKLPPAAMWIQECIIEQSISSKVHQRHFRTYGYLAKLPLPLFVYRLTPQQNERYAQHVRARLSADALTKIDTKLADGLGIEVYYYPTLPVRAADIPFGADNQALKSMLTEDGLGNIFEAWVALLARMLHLGYMPYAPWHHGMGSCVDPGNACIDGGFSDLLTLVTFRSIPGEGLFRQCLHLSMRALSDSILALCAAAADTPPVYGRGQSSTFVSAYVFERLREHVQSSDRGGNDGDTRLMRFFETPTVGDLIHEARETRFVKVKRGSQFTHERDGLGKVATA